MDYAEFEDIRVGDSVYIDTTYGIEWHTVVLIKEENYIRIIVLDNGNEYTKYDYAKGVIGRYEKDM